MRLRRYIIYLICLCSGGGVVAQESDSVKIKEILSNVSAIYRAKRDTSVILLNQAEKMLNKLKLKNEGSRIKLEMELYDLSATVYYENARLSEARKYYELLLERNIKIKDTLNTAGVYYCMGMLNHGEGNIPMAIKCYSIALETYELKHDEANVALQWYSLAQLYGEQNDSIKELEYYTKSLKIYESLNNQWGIALLQGAFGNLNLRHNNYSLALMFFRRNLDIYSAGSGDFWGIGNSLYAIGEVYRRMGKLDSAYSNYSRSLEVRRKTGYKLGIAFTLNALAQVYYKQGDIKNAEKFGLNSYNLAKEMGSPGNVRSAAKTLHSVYKKQGDFAKAFRMYDEYIRMTDSLQNEKNKKAIYQQQLNYEFEKKTALEEENQKSRDTIAVKEKQRQKVVIYVVSGGLFLVFFLAIFIFAIYRQKRRANIAIIGQKRVIEEKQKAILDSIHYARRIQYSLMPTEKYIIKKLSELQKKY